MAREPGVLGGEFRDPDKDRQLWAERTAFLHAIADVATHVLQELSSDVLPAYQIAREATKPMLSQGELVRLWRRGSSNAGVYGHRVDASQPVIPGDRPVVPDWYTWKFGAQEWSGIALTGPEELCRLRDEMQTWASRFLLDVNWMLDVSLRTLTFWDHGRCVGSFAPVRFVDVVNTPGFSLNLHDKSSQFSFEPWVPQWTTQRQYEAAITAAFDAYGRTLPSGERLGESDSGTFKHALREYLREQRTAVAALGLPRTQRTNANNAAGIRDQGSLRAFRWLAYACGGLTAKEIADRHYEDAGVRVSVRAIQRSNQKRAQSIALPWYSKPGQPHRPLS